MNVLLVVGIAPPPVHRAGSSVATLFAELSAPPATADARKSWVRSNQLLREAVQDLAAEGADDPEQFSPAAPLLAEARASCTDPVSYTHLTLPTKRIV